MTEATFPKFHTAVRTETVPASLEVVVRRPDVPDPSLPPILFVHGAWHGAWCWEGFQDRLAARGFETHAVSLRGHGKSGGRLGFARVRDYVRDVERAASAMREPPVLVGHSMGGFVVQKYLERNAARAAVYLASAPPNGVLSMFLRLARQDPVAFLRCNFTMSCEQVVSDARRVRRLLFSAGTDPTVVDGAHRRLGKESYLAILDMLALDLPKSRPAIPTAVFHGLRDGCFDAVDAARLADAVSVDPIPFDVGHDMMLDDGWEVVCDGLVGFVAAL